MVNGGTTASDIPFPVKLRNVEDFCVDGLEPCPPVAVFTEWTEEPWTATQFTNSDRKDVKDGVPPLFMFAYVGDVESGKQEVHQGANPCAKDEQGVCPLMVAAQEGHAEFVKFLLDSGAKVDQRTKSGWTSLFYATVYNRLEVAQLLCLPEIINAVDNNGASAAIYCARRGLVEILRLLCLAGIETNKTDKQSRTALMAAAQCGNVESVKVLLEHGATTNLQCEIGATALLIAASFLHKDVVSLLAKAEDINLCDNTDRSPLLVACSLGQVACAVNMVKLGADVNHRNMDGMSPLMVAVCQSNGDLVKMLLQNNADNNLKNKCGMTALDFAHIINNSNVKRLLQPKPSDNKSPYREGTLLQNKDAFNILLFMNKFSMIKKIADSAFKEPEEPRTCDYHTPLMVAAQVGNLEAVQFLLDKGVNVNQQLRNGCTALALAIAKDHVAIFDRLIGYGADINLTDSEGQTMLFNCAADGNLHGLLKLERLGASIDKRNQNRETPLMAAAMGGHVDVVKYLWKMAAQVNTKNRDGLSALDLARVYGQQQVLGLLKDKHDLAYEEKHELGHKLLEDCLQADINAVKRRINSGAPINFRDPELDMRTPLICATRPGDLAIVELLVEKGASVNIRDIHFRTPLFYACLNRHTEIVKYLIEQGANVNVSDVNGHTALMCTSQAGYADVVAELLRHRALVNNKDNKGLPALRHAVLKSHPNVVHVLLSSGIAYVDTVDSKNRTVLCMACVMGSYETVKVLLDHGADINTQLNEKKKTPLIMAVEEGDLDMVKLLVKRGAAVEEVEYRGLTAHEIAEKRYLTDIHAFLVEKYCERAKVLAENSSTTAGGERKKCPADGPKPFSGKAEGEKNLLDMCAKDWALEDAIKFIVEAGANINCKDENGLTAALISVKRGYFKHIPWLIKYGADMNCKDENGRTPLMYSLEDDQYSVIYTILEKKVDVDTQDVEGTTALMIAIKRNMFEIVPLLLQQVVHVNIADAANNTALSYCAMNPACEASVFRKLLEKGAHADHINHMGDTPLLLALKYENRAVSEILLNTPEIDLIHRNHCQEDALLLGCRTNRYCFVDMLAPLHDFFDPKSLELSLRLFMCNCSSDCIQRLLQQGLDLNAECKQGETLVFASVRHKNLESLEFLASLGADINHQNDKGQTLAMLVSEMEEVELQRTVLRVKPNLSLKDNQGQTAVDISLAKANYSFYLLVQDYLGDVRVCTSEYILCTLPESCPLVGQDLVTRGTTEPDDLLGCEFPFSDPVDDDPLMSHGYHPEVTETSCDGHVGEDDQHKSTSLSHRTASKCGLKTERGKCDTRAPASTQNEVANNDESVACSQTGLVNTGQVLGNQRPVAGGKGGVMGNQWPIAAGKGEGVMDYQGLIAGGKGGLMGNQRSLIGNKSGIMGSYTDLEKNHALTMVNQDLLMGTKGGQGLLMGDAIGVVSSKGVLVDGHGGMVGKAVGEVVSKQSGAGISMQGTVVSNRGGGVIELGLAQTDHSVIGTAHRDVKDRLMVNKNRTPGSTVQRPLRAAQTDTGHSEHQFSNWITDTSAESVNLSRKSSPLAVGSLGAHGDPVELNGNCIENRYVESLISHTDPDLLEDVGVQGEITKLRQLLQNQQELNERQAEKLASCEEQVQELEKLVCETMSENQALRLRMQDMENENTQYRSQIEKLQQGLAGKDKVIPSLPTDVTEEQKPTEGSAPCKTPEEDKCSLWQICACGLDDCPTCVAEKAATGTAPESEWQSISTYAAWEGDAQDGLAPDFVPDANSDETRLVDIVTIKVSHNDKVFLYRFHMTVSNSALSDKSRSYCSACSLAALLFAHNYKMAPCPLYSHVVTDLLFNTVKKSIAEATETVNLNFQRRTRFLEPSETLMLCSHLDLELEDEMQEESLVYETLLHHMLNLAADQILLFYRMDHYKVLSVTATEDGQHVLVFDPQWHSEVDKVTRETSWTGAHLYWCKRQIKDAKKTTNMLSNICGDLKGHSRLAILKCLGLK